MLNSSPFELDSVTTCSFTPSVELLAESLKSGILLCVDAEYKDSLFMVTELKTSKTTVPTDLSNDELSEFVVPYRLRKIDASHLSIDSQSHYKDLSEAKELLLFDEDVTPRQFTTVDHFTMSASDCLWNIPSDCMSHFFHRNPASPFNDCQVWLAQLFLNNKATKLAFTVALRKVGKMSRSEFQPNLC